MQPRTSDTEDAQRGAEDADAPGADALCIAGKRYASRLIIGTGKYRDFAQTAAALDASGAEIVTVAVRRVNLSDPTAPRLTDHIDTKRFTLLPNSAGCHTAEEAARTLRLAREAGGWSLVKLEVIGDRRSLYPDMGETLRAAEMLLADGFEVMVYCSDDPVAAKRLEDMGCCAIMPLAAPIGSGLGICNPVNIRLIVEQAQVPVLVDAGVGTASDAAMALAFCAAAGLPPQRVVVVGDNPCDLLMARAAGAGAALGVLTGTGSRAELGVLADAVLPSVAALPAWLDARAWRESAGA